jgi:acyl-CoA ligase (AMP-forming) (exosortase A-associated)
MPADPLLRRSPINLSRRQERMPQLLHELVFEAEALAPQAPALVYQGATWDYTELAGNVRAVCSGLLRLGLGRGERVAVFMEKRLETVAAMFGTAAAGGAFVPVNPLLKGDQVGYILRDCNVRVLVTTNERLALLADTLATCPDLRCVVTLGELPASIPPGPARSSWQELVGTPANAPAPHRTIDVDMTAILYTSGSTGKPKGVVLSHRNMVAGAVSVASYIENTPADRILSVLPLSFDAGFSQLTTAFRSGACCVLINYLLPRDVVVAAERERITGITAVPPLWIQLAQLQWPAAVQERLRYIANTGGRMPRATLDQLRSRLPSTKPFLMYGLTEAFRSTYLPPDQVDRRPDSIGKAIPNAEIMVVREDGTPCAPGEPGELVHRGALVSLGYWNDPEKTAERFRPAPGQPGGLTMPEMAVWSGDTVRVDDEGYLYFIGRRDEMIKTSGYRVSPTEIEEVVYATGLVAEVAALGVSHPVLGQAVVLVVKPADGAALEMDRLMAECRQRLPGYMVPAHVATHAGNLPRNPNGKIDRKLLGGEFAGLFEEQTA